MQSLGDKMKRSMHRIGIVIIIMLSVISSVEAGYCWQIKNKDMKALCKSKFEHKKNCWLIKSQDMQAYCEASAYGKKSCWQIKEQDLQMMCKAEMGSK